MHEIDSFSILIFKLAFFYLNNGLFDCSILWELFKNIGDIKFGEIIFKFPHFIWKFVIKIIDGLAWIFKWIVFIKKVLIFFRKFLIIGVKSLSRGEIFKNASRFSFNKPIIIIILLDILILARESNRFLFFIIATKMGIYNSSFILITF